MDSGVTLKLWTLHTHRCFHSQGNSASLFSNVMRSFIFLWLYSACLLVLFVHLFGGITSYMTCSKNWGNNEIRGLQDSTRSRGGLETCIIIGQQAQPVEEQISSLLLSWTSVYRAIKCYMISILNCFSNSSSPHLKGRVTKGINSYIGIGIGRMKGWILSVMGRRGMNFDRCGMKCVGYT